MSDNIAGIWPSADIPNPPQMSYVYFLDGFDHYTALADKWTSVNGTALVKTESGTWYDLPSTNPGHLYDTNLKRGNCLSFPGTYEPGDALPYIEMDLQELARLRVLVSLNLKADAYTGIPFIQLYDSAHNLVGGFAFTPEGLPHTMYGALYTNYRFATIGAMYTHPGMWVNIKCGVGFAVQDDPAEGVEGTLGLRMDVNYRKSLTGFGAFYDIDPTGLKVQYIRISSAGTNTLISDIICLAGEGMINEANNIHTLLPKKEGGPIPTFLFAGTNEDVDEYPPDTSSFLEFTSTCDGDVWAYIEASKIELPRGPMSPGDASRAGYIAGGRNTDTQPGMFGLIDHAYGTIQMNALSQGLQGAVGIISPPAPTYQLYETAASGLTGFSNRDKTIDGDSNVLFHADRGSWKYDITQICHWHRWIRRLWRTNTFNNVWAGVMCTDI